LILKQALLSLLLNKKIPFKKSRGKFKKPYRVLGGLIDFLV